MTLARFEKIGIGPLNTRAAQGTLAPGTTYQTDNGAFLAVSPYKLTALGSIGEAGNPLLRAIQRCYVESGVFLAPFDGVILVRFMGGGGGGATGTNATGGGAAAWGQKQIEVLQDDLLSIVIGAGGLGKTAAGNGNNGGDSVLYLNGVEVARCPGGSGGRINSVASGVSGVPVNCDVGMRGGSSPSGAYTSGGAASLNFELIAAPAGVRFGSGSMTAATASAPGISIPSLLDWGILSSAHGFTAQDGTWRGGLNTVAGRNGAFGCGGGYVLDNAGGIGGFGAGGGGAFTSFLSGSGGNGYAYLRFAAKG